jgi:phosphoribosylformylglycinamidine cyclo-ligase
MTDDSSPSSDEELTYAKAGVDIDASESATDALLQAVGETPGDYAGLIDIGNQYLAVTTDGVGTKLLIAEAIAEYSTIGIDCVAMNVNDLVAEGVRPIGFVDYLAVDNPNEEIASQIGVGLQSGADRADISLIGGETAVMPEVINGFDLAGTCVGLAPKSGVLTQTAQPGDIIAGFPSSGIHSNGLTLARKAIQKQFSYTDQYPESQYNSIAEALLEPTKIYTHLLEPIYETGVRTAAHITGGGWTNLERMGENTYNIHDPLPVPSIFELIQESGNIDDREMYRTFNMGIGFVCAGDPSVIDSLVAKTDGEVIGEVDVGTGVKIDGMVL